MKRLKKTLVAISIVALLSIGFFTGFSVYPKLKPCPTIVTDTIVVYDSSWHMISDSIGLVIKDLKKEVEYWKNHRDTIKLPGEVIEIPADIDTAAILKDYYSVYKYGWEKSDSLINIVDSVIVTQNVPVYHSIRYKINKPFLTIINKLDNSISYNRYLQVGSSIPLYNYRSKEFDPSYFKDMSFKVNYVFPKGFVGAEINHSMDYLSLCIGTTLCKFKK